MSSIWEEVKNHIKRELPTKSFSLWINPITVVDQEDDGLTLGCPNRFSRDWVKENYSGIIEEKLAQIGGDKCRLAWKIMPLKRKEHSPGASPGAAQMTLPNLVKNGHAGRRGLNHDFTFDRFVVGKCNEFAYSASKALALGGQWPYNSLFLLSSTGLGKSHLSQSIGHEILAQNPAIKVLYVTAEDFVNEMVFALKNGRIEEFKGRYRRECDVLLLEEVHFFGGKERTQLELGHTLDVLANERKRIIFTSALLPKDIPNMTKRLSSRLTSGIITTLDKPDYETRVKILQKKSSEQGLLLSEEIVRFLAKRLTGDVRQMESALRCLKAKSELLKVKIDLDLAEEVLSCHVGEERRTSMEDINNLVCRYFRIEPQLLKSKSRKKIHSYPRNIYVYLCRHFTDATLEDIGKSIDRNHSTVLYASEVVEHKMKVDTVVKNQVGFLSERLMTAIS